ncbi:hypothetical protein K505DRAFT_368955 [Melanomma pulvis-pyrius CBS 109.77]|uniref:Uncharacterized protein n=1 Tax=Melanomma pulvis-pyrius CBS 109.77 TaxID=1314802 RepID=A0A6A6WNI6_9PLEO|nr:hypothetical protein K505DRAFT_368955 [Melanomma pulvis-pyrius CBS 109.77]
MDNLPLIALEAVCEYLAHAEPERGSLLAFACTSRNCYAVATRELFSRVRLRVDDESQLQHDLARLEHLLETTNTKRFVRVVKVYDIEVDENEDEDDGNEDEAEDPFSIQPRYPTNPFWPWPLQRRNESWKPFARFLSGLALGDLIWASGEEVPACVLSVLYVLDVKNTFHCRLHVHTFQLWHFFREDDPDWINSPESLLATSPYLHSIIGPCTPTHTRRKYYDEIRLQRLLQSAPRLKHVRMWFQGKWPGGVLNENLLLPWDHPYYHRADGSSDKPEKKGELESLTIDSANHQDDSQLLAWEAQTDFSYLRSFKIDRLIGLQALQRLADLALRSAFNHLQVLELPAGESRYKRCVEMDLAMERLLSCLRPLEQLSVRGVGDASFEAALKQHGASLQCFRVRGLTLSRQQITRLRNSCTNIRELRIEILRKENDNEEVQIYRTLGAIGTLEKLTLDLQCTACRYPIGPNEPEPSSPTWEVVIRDIFINTAMDEDLARSIFGEVLAANDAIYDPLPPKLSYVKLQMADRSRVNGQSVVRGFRDTLRWIGSHWVCKRDPRDTHRGRIIVEESARRDRLETGMGMSNDMNMVEGSIYFSEVWTLLWPETGKGWKEDWKSFPLCKDSTD